MNFLPEEIEKYAEDFTSPESDVLKELNRETHSKIYMPQMLSGHLQGATLKMFSKMIQPKRILEIGTFTGYSTICLAEGLTEDGIIHTIDINAELEPMARKYFSKSGMENKIQYHIGKAMNIIPSLNEVFDLVFIDADKENYSNYYDLIFDKVRSGGIIIADNVLWSGKVLQEKVDKDTHALKEYCKKVLSDSRAECLLLPIRDGLMIARKK